MNINLPFIAGDVVTCSGFRGVIKKVCDGALTGMLEVQLKSGLVCVGISEVRAENLTEARRAQQADERLAEVKALAEKIVRQAEVNAESFKESGNYGFLGDLGHAVSHLRELA